MLQYNNQLCFKRVYFVLQMAKWQSFVSRDKKLHTPFLTVGYPCCHSFKLLLHYISKHIYIFVYLYGILTLLWYRFRVVCCCCLWGWSTHIWNIFLWLIFQIKKMTSALKSMIMSLMSQTFTITCSLQFMKRFVKCSHWTPVIFNAKRTSGNFDLKNTV